MPLYVKRDCRPGGWFGCTAPIKPDQLTQLVTTILKAMQAQGIENQILTGSPHIILPPDGAHTIAAVLSHPDNQKKYGLLHWTAFSTICIRRGVLETVVKGAVFKPGDGYGEFINAIRKLGLEVVDVDLA